MLIHGNNENELRNNLMMMADSFYIPKERKPPAKPDGEDAHFFFQKAQVIAVADGVGGWAKKGVDAGEYARELMRNAADAVKGCSVPAAVNPKSVLASAFAKTESPGSSTACIISLAGSRLFAVNIGDSGFAVIRGGRTVYRSPAQQSRFNAPYQLGGTSGEGLESAAEMEVEMESGDVVIAATDGFFDNVFPEEAEGMVGRCLSHGMTSAMVARELATAAHSRSRQSDAVVPFGVAAREAGMEYSGGKADDITVVVAYVMPYVNSCCLHSFTGYLWSF